MGRIAIEVMVNERRELDFWRLGSTTSEEGRPEGMTGRYDISEYPKSRLTRTAVFFGAPAIEETLLIASTFYQEHTAASLVYGLLL